jgi:hypothetical protein
MLQMVQMDRMVRMALVPLGNAPILRRVTFPLTPRPAPWLNPFFLNGSSWQRCTSHDGQSERKKVARWQ